MFCAQRRVCVVLGSFWVWDMFKRAVSSVTLAFGGVGVTVLLWYRNVLSLLAGGHKKINDRRIKQATAGAPLPPEAGGAGRPNGGGGTGEKANRKCEGAGP